MKTVELDATFGFPYLNNGDFIEIVGKYGFDGIYWVRSITHTMNKSGYVMTINADSLPLYISTSQDFTSKPKDGAPMPRVPLSDDCPGSMILPAGTYDKEAFVEAPDGRRSYTNRFGNRYHPIYNEWRIHHGMDLDADCGDAVYAALKGTVTFAGWQGGYGYVVKTETTIAGITWTCVYAHLRKISPNIVVGATVVAGAFLGEVGDTGDSVGCHLHFELHKNGEPIDPAPCIGI